MDAIEIADLTKVYRRGSAPALEGLNLRVAQGELFGFLGPNGAGKTTTIRILMTLLRPTRGSAKVTGHDVLGEPQEAMKRVGFMPESPGFYAALSGKQHLRYWATLYHMGKSDLDGKVGGLIDRVGLTGARDMKVKAYSLGMKRRLALAGALLPDPELLILDEPSLGLDPQGIAYIRSVLLDLHKEGRTVFLSSHILSEVERICTKVGILHRGHLLRVDTPRALAHIFGGASSGLEVETKGVGPQVMEELRRMPGVAQATLEGNLLRVLGSLDDDAAAEVNRRLIAGGVAILSSRRLEPNLEQAFLALTEGKG